MEERDFMAQNESNITNIKDIRILVKNEEDLYNSFSPYNDVDNGLKLYINQNVQIVIPHTI